jgi:drug/metabolite transporter (DMT)-like permease
MVSAATGQFPLPVLTAPGAVPRVRAGGLLVGLASALAFSSSGPIMKPLLEAGWSLGAVLLLRMAGAALVLSPALVRALVRDPQLLRRHWALFLGFGATGVAGCQIFYFAAMQRMPVAVALLIQYLAPVMLVVWAWARTRRRPSTLVIGGSIAAIVGLVLVVDVTGVRFDLLGTLFALTAAICVAAYFLLCDRAGEDVPPLALASGGLVVGVVIMGVLVTTGILPFRAVAVSIDLAGLEVPWWAAIAWVALGATTLGYALGVIAIGRLGSRVASFVGLSEVLFALLFAWALLGEAPTLVQVLGGAILIGGVVLVRADAQVEAGGAPPSDATAPVPVVPAP